MTRSSNHVISSKEQDGWAFKKAGSIRISRSFVRTEEAVKYGRELSKRESTELYIHKKDGRIQERNSYSKVPFPPKG